MLEVFASILLRSSFFLLGFLFYMADMTEISIGMGCFRSQGSVPPINLEEFYRWDRHRFHIQYYLCLMT